MTQKLIIEGLKMKTRTEILRQYKDSKQSLPSPCVAEKFYNIQGYSNELYLTTKKWFDNAILPEQKRGLNIQGYMRLVAM